MDKKVLVSTDVIVSALFGKGRKAEEATTAFLMALRTCKVYGPPKLKTVMEFFFNKRRKCLREKVSALFSNFKETKVKKKKAISENKKANAYLNVCLKTKADFLLTEDKDLLKIQPKKLKYKSLNSLKIIPPKNFLKTIIK